MNGPIKLSSDFPINKDTRFVLEYFRNKIKIYQLIQLKTFGLVKESVTAIKLPYDLETLSVNLN
jgi:hypothetical protein